MPRVRAVSIVGRFNNPVFLHCFGDASADTLQLTFTLHTALDTVAERASRSQSVDSYLGLLCPIEDVLVYGYATNTDAKILLVVEGDDARDSDVKGLFSALHGLFVDAMSNPFQPLEGEIVSPTFAGKVQAAVQASPFD